MAHDFGPKEFGLYPGRNMTNRSSICKSGFAAAVLAISMSFGMAEAAEPKLTTVAEGLDFPWSLAFLPDGAMLVTERSGQLRRIDGGVVSEPIAGVPEVYVESQGGLFDVVLHPDYETNHLIYLTYAGGTPEANATHVARARYDGTALHDLEVIFSVDRKKDTPVHYGGRLAFLADGTFVVTTGDGFDYREQAQNLGNHLGSTIRLNDDGSVPADNPYVGDDKARDEIWTNGHRNPQGLVLDPVTGGLYLHEHGPKGGDELNLIEPGKNYGWPVITYGRDYSGAAITPWTERPGLEQPMIHWTPSVGPSGLAIYYGDKFPEWQGDLFVGTLVEHSLRRVDLEDGKVVGQEILLSDLGERIRDVRTGPDGSLYILTDSDEGRVIRLDP